MCKEGKCSKCGRKFSKSAVLPGHAITLLIGGPRCYQCYYEEQGWDLETCVDCEKKFPLSEGLVLTMDGPLCMECNPSGAIDPPPESALPEGADLPPGVGFPVSESVMGSLVSNFVSGMFDRMGSRERIATVMLGANQVFDGLQAIAHTIWEGREPSFLSREDLIKESLKDADALIAALRSNKGDKNENGEVQ